MTKKLIDLGKVVGDSAYDLAVKHGFTGTLVEYLASLVGPKGKDGIDGKDGKDGTNGIDGEQGPEGPRGPQGVPGERGQSIDFKGALNSPDDLPTEAIKDGDAYLIDTQLYVWLEESHEWIKSGSIQGPQGIQGEQGVQGKQGIPGIPGRDGKDGVNGIDGKNGVDGRNGIDGKNGEKGADGKNGLGYRPIFAYADSNDGTVNFTNKYPNYNLLDNSNFAKTITPYGGALTAFYGLPSNVVGQLFTPQNNIGNNADLTISAGYMRSLGLAPNQKVTVSVVLTNNSNQAGSFQFITMSQNSTVDVRKPITVNGVAVPWESVNINPRVTVNVPGGSSARYAFTFNVENFDKAAVGQFIILRDTTTQSGPTVLSYSKVKIELGDKPTAWVGARGENDFGDWPTFIGVSVLVDGDTSQKTPSDYVWSRLRGAQGPVGPKGEVGGGLPLLRGQITFSSRHIDSLDGSTSIGLNITIPKDAYKSGDYKVIGFGVGNDDGMTIKTNWPYVDRETKELKDITPDNSLTLRQMMSPTYNPMAYTGTALTTVFEISTLNALNDLQVGSGSMGFLEMANPSALVQYPDGTNHLVQLDVIFRPVIASTSTIGLVKPSGDVFKVDATGNMNLAPECLPVNVSIIHAVSDNSYFISIPLYVFTTYLGNNTTIDDSKSVTTSIHILNDSSELATTVENGHTYMNITSMTTVNLELHPNIDGEFEKVDGLIISAKDVIKSISVNIPVSTQNVDGTKTNNNIELEFKNVNVNFVETGTK